MDTVSFIGLARFVPLLVLVACNLSDADVGQLDTGATPMSEDGSDGATVGDDEGAASGEGGNASDPDPTTSSEGGGTTGGTAGGTTGLGDSEGGEESTAESTGGDGPAPVECCVVPPLGWYYVGGLAPTSTASTLGDCNAFARLHDDNTFDEIPPVECASELSCEPGDEIVGTDDINTLLAGAELQAIIDEGSEFYGVNAAPFDGANFIIELDGIELGIGGFPCDEPGDGPLSCIPTPEPLAEFAALLQALTVQQGESCPD